MADDRFMFTLYRYYMQSFLYFYYYSQEGALETKKRLSNKDALYIASTEIDKFFHDCAIALWANEEGMDLVKCSALSSALNNAYIYEWDKLTYTGYEVYNLIDERRSQNCIETSLEIPAFFMKLLSSDVKNQPHRLYDKSAKTSFSRGFALAFNRLAEMFVSDCPLPLSFSNRYLEDLQKRMLALCNKENVVFFDENNTHLEFCIKSCIRLFPTELYEKRRYKQPESSYQDKKNKTYPEILRDNYRVFIPRLLEFYCTWRSDYFRAIHIDIFVQSCAVYIWKLHNKEATKCIAVMKDIFLDTRLKDFYTLTNLEKEMYSDIKVPDFTGINEICKWDLFSGTALSRALANSFIYLADMFAVDDDELLTNEEYNTVITDICKKLESVCDEYNVRQLEPDDVYSYCNIIEDNTLIADAERTKYHNGNKTVLGKPSVNLSDVLDSLDRLVGLNMVKKDVKELVNFVKVQNTRKERNLKTTPMSFHLVFTGNPGTGKTTVARLIAKIYKKLGILPESKVVEVDRSDLVAGYVGQTAIQTQEILQSALGGVLFVDEAYTLSSKKGNDFGQEAIDTILKFMEDNRNNLIVIVAGYNDLMQDFINSNPGLKSRFSKYIHFDDYTGSEMYEIFTRLCKENQYDVADEAAAVLQDYFTDLYDNRDSNFGNARVVRNLFERIVTVHSNRIVEYSDINDNVLTTFLASDVNIALSDILSQYR